MRREEWGEESRRGHQELGQPKELTALVCAGKIVNVPLFAHSAPQQAGWRAAVDPSRWAYQFGDTTRTRPAVPLPKLAVKQLYALQLSRLFRPMRTFDEARAPEDLLAHTSWIDLLDETSHERQLRSTEVEDEFVVERIIRSRCDVDGSDLEYLVKWEGYDKREDRSWVPRGELLNTDALAAFETRQQTDSTVEEEEEPTASPERRMMYRIFNGLQHEAIPRSVTDSVYSILADAEPIGNGR